MKLLLSSHQLVLIESFDKFTLSNEENVFFVQLLNCEYIYVCVCLLNECQKKINNHHDD